MNSIIQDLLGKFSNIYTLQDHGEVFQSVPDMLQAIGGVEFYNLTQLSVQEYLQEKGLSELLIDELVTAVMRINYGQSTEMNAFAGKVYYCKNYCKVDSQSLKPSTVSSDFS